MIRDTILRRSCLLATILVAAVAAAKPRPKPRVHRPVPYPTKDIQEWGYEGAPADEICCRNRLIGWTDAGKVAVLSASYNTPAQSFLYAIQLHDPEIPDPEELFGEELYLADDTLPEGCPSVLDPARCVWSLRQKEIGEILRMNGVKASAIRMRRPPPFAVRTIFDPLSPKDAPRSVGLSVTDSAGRLLLEMPDTTGPGLHLWPIGTIARNRPDARRYLVLRLFERRPDEAASEEVGVRFLRLEWR